MPRQAYRGSYSVWRERLMLLLTGGALTVVCAVLAVAADAGWDWPWMTSLVILLAIAIMSVSAFAVSERGHPPTSGGGSLNIYIEITARDADSGRLTWLTRPEGEVYAWVLLINVIPGLTLAGLIAAAIA